MIFPLSSAPTEAMLAMVESRHDDGTPPLCYAVEPSCHDPRDLRVLRHDLSELCEAEAAHVRGVLAAHAVEPIGGRPRDPAALAHELAVEVGDDGTGDLRVIVDCALRDDPGVTIAELVAIVVEARDDARAEAAQS